MAWNKPLPPARTVGDTGHVDDTNKIIDAINETKAAIDGISISGIPGTNGFASFSDDPANPGTLLLRTEQSLFNSVNTFIKNNVSAQIVCISDSTAQVAPANPGSPNANGGGWVYGLAQKIDSLYPNVTVRVRSTTADAGDAATLGAWHITRTITSSPSVRSAVFPGNTSASLVTPTLSMDIPSTTLDVDVAVLIKPSSWTQGSATINYDSTTTACLAGRYFDGSSTGTAKSWLFSMSGGRLWMTHWATPLSTTPIEASVLMPTSAPFNSTANPVWLRCKFATKTGSNHTKTFFYSTDNYTWVQIGSPQVVSGNATYDNTSWVGTGSALYSIGSHTAGTKNRLTGRIYEVQFRQGLDGPTTGPTLPDQWDGSNITMEGNPILDFWSHCHSQASVLHHIDPLVMGRLRSSIGASATIVALSHNDQSRTTAYRLWEAYTTLINDAKAKNPHAPVIILSQNPQQSSATSPEAHKFRSYLMQDFATKNSCGFIDAFKEWERTIGGGTTHASLMGSLNGVAGADPVHPGAPGHQVTANYVAKFF